MTFPNVVVEAMGAVAGFLGLVGFIPQVAQSLRRGTAGDLNVATLLIFALNTLLWSLYGIAKNAWALAASDAAILGLIGILLWLKLRDLSRARAASRSA